MASETVKNIKVEFKVDLTEFNKQMQTVSTKINEVSSTFDSVADEIEKNGKKLTKNSGLDDLAEQAEETSETLEDMTESVEEVGEGLDTASKRIDVAESAFDNLEDAMKDVSKSADTLQTDMSEAGSSISGAEDVIFDLSGAVDETSLSMKGLGDESDLAALAAGKVGNNTYLTAFTSAIKSAGSALQSMGKTIESAGKKVTQVGKDVTKYVTTPLVGVGTASAMTAANFEAAMNQVAATMGMTAEEIKNGCEDYEKLEAAAKEMGSTTQFSASQAAEALNYLALAGYDANKSVEMLPKVLNLAAAGGIDLAYASDLVTDSMSALGLSAEDADSFIDQMAKTSQKSNTSVSQLGEAILTVGGTAKMLAGGTTELNTALGILADNGTKGSEGGTALRNTILSLASPTDKAAKLMKSLGVNAYDSKGNLRPLNDTLGDLNKAMSSMSDHQKNLVLGEIFNKNDLKSVQALLAGVEDRTYDLSGALEGLGIDVEKNKNVIRDLADGFSEATDKGTFVHQAMKDLGISADQAAGMYDALAASLQPVGSRFDELSGFIDESQNAAENMAETMNSGTKGALTQMKSALEGVAITIGERITPYIEIFANKVSELCDWFQNLSPEMQDNIIKWGALVAAIGPALVILGTVITVVGKVVTAIGTIVSFIGSLGSMFATLGGWISAAWGAISAFVAGISWPVVAIGAAIAALVAGIWWLVNNWDTACAWIKKAWDWLCEAWSACVDWVIDYLKHCWEFWSDIFSKMSDFLCETWDNIVTAIKNYLQYCLDFWVNIFTNIRDFFVNLWSQIIENFKTSLSNIKNFLVNALNFFIEKWQNIFTAIRDFFVNTWNNISNFFKNLMNSITSFASNAWNGLKNMITNFATGIKNGVVGAFNGLKNGVMGVWNGIVNGIKGCVNGILKMVNSMIRGLNKLNIQVPDWVPAIGGKSIGFNIPEIPLLATGGQVNFGTAIVGEAGPELLQQTAKGTKVTPLSTHEKAGGISQALGGGLTVQIDKFINNTDRDIEELSHRLADHFSRTMKGRGLSYE